MQGENPLRQPMFTTRELRNLIVPLVIEMVLVTTIGMADTVMVAYVGEGSVSAVSLVDAINAVFLNLFTAISSGGAVIAAQYIGSEDRKNALDSKKQLIYIIVGLSLLIAATILIFNKSILHLMYPTTETGVLNQAKTYFYLTALSYPFHGITAAGTALFRAERNSKVSLFISITANLINIGGNAILIYLCGWGVAGAGTATLLSRVVAAVIMLRLLCNKKYNMRIENIFDFKLRPDLIKRILGIAVPNGVENSLFNIGKLLVQGIIASFGTAAVAANAIAMSLLGVANSTGSGFSLATLTVVGQCVGAEEYEQSSMYVKKLLKAAYISLGIFFSAMFLSCDFILPMFNLSAEAVEMASACIRMSSLFGMAVWPTSFMLGQALRASGDAKFPMMIAILSMGLFRVLFSGILGIYFGMGLLGVWLAMCLDWIARSICFIFRFAGGYWKTKRAI